MAIGNHSFWVIVDTLTRRAVTPENDARRALRFPTEAAALAYAWDHYAPARLGTPAWDQWIVVHIPA